MPASTSFHEIENRFTLIWPKLSNDSITLLSKGATMPTEDYANIRAFIVTPFETKKDAKGNEIDFDQVRTTLIEPALKELGIKGGTTGMVIRSGSIHTTMFQQLLTADLVVAEVSIHNANVFYELGIRHALRARHTFLIRCKASKFPFDLQTDRY